MAENCSTSINSTLNSLFESMDGFISTKTVVGEPITFDDTILLPLVDVSFGVAAGAFAKEKGKNAGGGLGGKISPCCVLVVRGDMIRLVNIKNQDSVSKILDLVPEIADRIISAVKSKTQSPEEAQKKEEAGEILSDMIADSVEKATEKAAEKAPEKAQA